MWWILVGVLADRLDYKDYNIAKLDQYVQKSRSFYSASFFFSSYSNRRLCEKKRTLIETLGSGRTMMISI